MTKAERTCNRTCFFAGRQWFPGEVIAEGDIPGESLPAHFGPSEEQRKSRLRTKAGVEGQKAPRPEVRAKGPLPAFGDVTAGEPATLAEAQNQILGETLLQKEGQSPVSLGEAQAFS